MIIFASLFEKEEEKRFTTTMGFKFGDLTKV